jgi:DNA-binding transcriptional LysR family regulator
MELAHLEAFVRVAEAESFTAAADKLGVERSSVSRAIAALEAEVGVQLFTRTTRQVALTPAGAALLAKVRPSLASLQEALAAVPERAEPASGTLTLTAPTDIAATVLPEILATFVQRHAGVRVELRVTNETLDLERERVDTALRASGCKRSDPELTSVRLSETEIAAFASPTYLAAHGAPRRVEDCAAHAWVLFRSHLLPPPFPAPDHAARVSVDDMLSMRGALESGVGLGLLPSFLAVDHVATGKLVRVLPKIGLRLGGLHLVHPRAPAGAKVARKVAAFRDHVVEHFAAHPLAGPP